MQQENRFNLVLIRRSCTRCASEQQCKKQTSMPDELGHPLPGSGSDETKYYPAHFHGTLA
jgi:hypothetical protein